MYIIRCVSRIALPRPSVVHFVCDAFAQSRTAHFNIHTLLGVVPGTIIPKVHLGKLCAISPMVSSGDNRCLPSRRLSLSLSLYVYFIISPFQPSSQCLLERPRHLTRVQLRRLMAGSATRGRCNGHASSPLRQAATHVHVYIVYIYVYIYIYIYIYMCILCVCMLPL